MFLIFAFVLCCRWLLWEQEICYLLGGNSSHFPSFWRTHSDDTTIISGCR